MANLLQVLTFSKLDSNLLVLATERTQARTVIERALKMFETELSHADIETTIEQIPNDQNVGEVLCDPGRLLQVIINFVTNSIKFTKTSDKRQMKLSYGSLLEPPQAEDYGVTFVKPRKKDHVEPHTTPVTPTFPSHINGDEEEAIEYIYLYFSVEDSGCGLTAEESQLLFERFAQVSPS